MRQSTSDENIQSARDNDSLTIGSYLVSFDRQRHYQRLRHHWMICEEAKPDKLVVWGYANTRDLAEFAARHAVEKLLSSQPNA